MFIANFKAWCISILFKVSFGQCLGISVFFFCKWYLSQHLFPLQVFFHWLEFFFLLVLFLVFSFNPLDYKLSMSVELGKAWNKQPFNSHNCLVAPFLFTFLYIVDLINCSIPCAMFLLQLTGETVGEVEAVADIAQVRYLSSLKVFSVNYI